MSASTTVDGGRIARRRAHPALRFVKEYPLLPVLVVALVVGSLANSLFLSPSNLVNVLAQSAVLGVLVVSQTLVMLTGRMDLSTESVVTLAPVFSVWLVIPVATGGLGIELDPFLGVLLTMLVGGVVGLVNGMLVMKVGLNSFVVTLAMLILLAGVAQGVGEGRTLYGISDVYLYLGSAMWLGIPVSVWIAVALFVAAGLFLRYHRVGRSLYAIGGNELAAAAAGIPVARTVIGVYVVSGLLAGLAGVLLTGRLSAATATQGSGLIFSVLAACVIGGISLSGGRGTMLGAASGVLLLGVVNNLLVLSNIKSYWISATYGLIILIALVLSRFTSGRRQL
ncbi:MAG: ATPase [Micrococcales bacterium 70-64]|nr:ABC transporter permease [Leifsonia sp.]ODU63744.1 MAG: ATPase [Leifsonia sp. SCN 70-46]OJX85435.1 MAG: ATPase [Micrococcales bacterium 70-64]